MKEEVSLLHSLDVPQSWREEINIKIDISDFNNDAQILKILSAIIHFFVKVGYSLDEILDGFNDLVSELDNEDDSNKEDNQTKLNIDSSLTLAEFTSDIKNSKEFIKYMYKMYIDDLEV